MPASTQASPATAHGARPGPAANRLPVFLLLSVAVHAVILIIAWHRPQPSAVPVARLAVHLVDARAPRVRPAPSPPRPRSHPAPRRTESPPHTASSARGQPGAVRGRHVARQRRTTAPTPRAVRTTSSPTAARQAPAARTPATAPAIPSSPAQAPAPAAAATRARLCQALARQLAFHRYYPPLARRRGWQGRVSLGLRVQPDGRLTNIRVLHTSGYAVLDRAAVDSLRSVRTVHVARRWLNGRHFDIVLPVVYKLLDG